MAFTNNDHENTQELLKAQAHIWGQVFNNTPMFLRCTVQLNIPDIIHKQGRPMTACELVDVLHVKPAKARFIHTVMPLLALAGFFDEVKLGSGEQTGYTLNHVSRLLVKDNPLSAAPMVLAMLDPILVKPFQHLSEWLLSDDPTSFETANGISLWKYASQDPRFNQMFNDAMASDGNLVASVVASECKFVFEGIETLVDVGGGTGVLAKAIVDAVPHIACTVLDLPHVVAGLQGSDKLKFTGGDMFVAVPPADAVILKWILHDWNDEDSVKILKQCKAAISGKRKAGKVIIIDIVMENPKDKKLRELELSFDLTMIMGHGARERNEATWAKLFNEAGFSGYKVYPVVGLRSLIELYP